MYAVPRANEGETQGPISSCRVEGTAAFGPHTEGCLKGFFSFVLGGFVGLWVFFHFDSAILDICFWSN